MEFLLGKLDERCLIIEPGDLLVQVDHLLLDLLLLSLNHGGYHTITLNGEPFKTLLQLFVLVVKDSIGSQLLIECLLYPDISIVLEGYLSLHDSNLVLLQ